MHALPALLTSVAFPLTAHALQCDSSYPWYKWASNTDAQDPCELVSDIRNSCAPNADPLQPLSYNPSGTNSYPGPNASIQNTCTCSYVVYNLMAACGDCQVGSMAPAAWPTYHVWAQACDAVNTGGIYPDALPPNLVTSIPGWARLSSQDTGDPRWSYGFSRAVAAGHLTLNPKILAPASPPCPSPTSPGLPIGTAFAGLIVGLATALLIFLCQRKRRARVIPPPTRYHTAPDNTPLHPLVARPAHAHGTTFLRRILEQEQHNDPRRIEPFDISAATRAGPFPPHPAVFPPRRAHPYPPALEPSRPPSQGPSRQSSLASLTHPAYPAHPRHSKSSSRPHTVASQFSSAGSAGPGPSLMPLHNRSPSEPPSPLPSDRAWPDVLEEPPAYRRKS